MRKDNNAVSKTLGLSGLKHGGTIQLSADNDSKAKAQKISKDPVMLMASIIKQQRSNYAKEISDFLAARMLAENPDYPMRTLLYDIYKNVMDDPFIHGQVENQRILPVKNKDFKILNKDGKTDNDKTVWLSKSWFNNMVKWAMESKFWGFSAAYLDEIAYSKGTSWINKLVLLERKNVHPERHVITKYQTDLNGYDYLSEPISNYVLTVGDPYDLGLLLKAVPMYIFKKHGWQNWDEFSEMFGIPIRTVKTATQDPRVIGEIEGWLQDMSTSAYGIFPEGTELDIKVSNQSDAFKVFAEAINMAKEELAILFNGQTMTSMNGSSRSQGEVHERTKEEITKDDEKFVKTFVNEQLIPFLRDIHGYPFADGDHFEWDQPEDLESLLTIYKGVYDLGFELDQQEVSERFRVKITGKRAATPSAANNDQEEPDDEEELKPGTKKPKKDLSAKPKDVLKLHADLQNMMFGGNA